MSKNKRDYRTPQPYPRRDSFFGIQFIRILHKSCAASVIGRDAVCLLTLVASTEDSARYQRAVTFWNHQIESVLGFRSPKKLNMARQRAIDHGWLAYWRTSDRSPGFYFVKVPADAQAFDDAEIEPPRDPTSLSVSGKQNGSETQYSLSVSGKQNGKLSASGKHSGKQSGKHSGKPPYPVPYPNPDTSCRDASRHDEATSSKVEASRKGRVTESDVETAEFIWQLIVELQPDRKPPNITKWANDVRLMREQDGRTHEQIRDVFRWANGDDFWRANILSPAKLRKKFDDLRLRMPRSTANELEDALTGLERL